VTIRDLCEDDDQLLGLVSRIRRVSAVEGLESTENFMSLGLRKQTYAWGTRRTGADA
jgi:Lrp/AsnC family transcriptional regulator for asnA, asnC and gidA